jgi:hypothetical protein
MVQERFLYALPGLDRDGAFLHHEAVAINFLSDALADVVDGAQIGRPIVLGWGSGTDEDDLRPMGSFSDSGPEMKVATIVRFQEFGQFGLEEGDMTCL